MTLKILKTVPLSYIFFLFLKERPDIRAVCWADILSVLVLWEPHHVDDHIILFSSRKYQISGQSVRQETGYQGRLYGRYPARSSNGIQDILPVLVLREPHHVEDS